MDHVRADRSGAEIEPQVQDSVRYIKKIQDFTSWIFFINMRMTGLEPAPNVTPTRT